MDSITVLFIWKGCKRNGFETQGVLGKSLTSTDHNLMAARDRYTLTLKCPKCGASGVAEVSEDDHPYMRDPGFQVDELPEGFAMVKESVYRRENVAQHKPCGEKFSL